MCAFVCVFVGDSFFVCVCMCVPVLRLRSCLCLSVFVSFGICMRVCACVCVVMCVFASIQVCVGIFVWDLCHVWVRLKCVYDFVPAGVVYFCFFWCFRSCLYSWLRVCFFLVMLVYVFVSAFMFVFLLILFCVCICVCLWKFVLLSVPEIIILFQSVFMTLFSFFFVFALLLVCVSVSVSAGVYGCNFITASFYIWDVLESCFCREWWFPCTENFFSRLQKINSVKHHPLELIKY